MKTLLKAAIASALLAGPVFAGGHAPWESVNDESLISFGSIKKDVVAKFTPLVKHPVPWTTKATSPSRSIWDRLKPTSTSATSV